MPNIYLALNPLDVNDSERFDVAEYSSPKEWFDGREELHDKVVICIRNRIPVLRAEWDKPLRMGDIVLFVVRPRGGGGSNPLRMVMMLSVMAFAGWAVGAMGMTGLMASSVRLGITMLGSALVNQILPTPQLPSTQKIPDPSPTYSLRGQSNMARIGQPIPAHYGKHIIWPDLVESPYYEYEDDQQWYCIKTCAGWGKITGESFKFGDVSLDSLSASDVSYQLATPGTAITILPSTVYTASVSGTELTDTWSASSYSNPPGSSVTKIAVDIAFNGLCYVKDDGGLDNRSVTVNVQARPVDDAGTEIGAWFALINQTVTNATVDTLRRTISATVTAGRYEIQVKRANAVSTDTRAREAAIFGGLRGYDYTPVNYGDVTIVAARIKATKLLSEQSLQQLNFVGTRWLRQWDGSQWLGLQPSRSIVWAFADLYTNINAGRQADNTLLLSELKVLHDQLDGLQHYFDYRFDQSGMKLAEAMQIVGRTGRSLLFQHSGYWRLVRDNAKNTPVQLFTADNIKDFELSIQAPQDTDPDALTCTYIDPDTWQAETLTYSEVSSPINPETIDMPGITGRAHAWSELVYLWRANRRRESGHLVTGMEGRIPTLHDLIAVSPDGVEWGYWGSLMPDGTLSNPLPFAAGKMMLRNNVGGSMGVYDITVAADGITVTGLPAGLALTNLDKEPIYYIAGQSASDIVLCRVTGIKPEQDDYVRMDFVVEDAGVYGADPSVPPDTTSGNGGGGSVVSNELVLPWLRATSTPAGDKFSVKLSWGGVTDATSYLLDVHPDGSSAWTRIYAGSSLEFDYTATAGLWSFRAAAVGKQVGDYKEISYQVGQGAITLPPPSASLNAAFIGASLQVKWTLVSGAAKYRVKVYDTATTTLRRTIDIVGDNWQYTYEDAKADGGPWRSLTIRLWSLDAAGNESLTYSQVLANNAQVGALTNISVTAFAGVISITYDWPNMPDTAAIMVFASSIDGFTPNSTNMVYDGKDAVIAINVPYGATRYLRLAAYDVWGKDNLTYSAQFSATASKITPTDLVDGLEPVQIVASMPDPYSWTGSAVISYSGMLYELKNNAWVAMVDASKLGGKITSTQITDGAISTPKLAANAVTAATIAANAVTAAKIQAGAISADKIAANAIAADKIAANAVTADKLSVNQLSAISAKMGTLTTGKLQNASASALFNLDAVGTSPFIKFADAYGLPVFYVDATGSVYARGDIQASSLTAGVAMVDTLHIKNAAVSIMSSGTAGAGTPPIGVWTDVCSVTHTSKGGSILIIATVDVESMGQATTSASDGSYSNAPYDIRYRIKVDGSVAGYGLTRVIQPASGSHYIAIEALISNPPNFVLNRSMPALSNKSISVLEMRR